jgi:hypothetical protein
MSTIELKAYAKGVRRTITTKEGRALLAAAIGSISHHTVVKAKYTVAYVLDAIEDELGKFALMIGFMKPAQGNLMVTA